MGYTDVIVKTLNGAAPIAFAAALLASATAAHAIVPGDVRWHDEHNDTTKITQILINAGTMNVSDPGTRTMAIAEMLTGTPYAADPIEGTREQLTVRLDSMDCTTFVETVLALEMTLEEQRSSWRDFIYNLERLRYRNGNVGTYSSRLHYFSDWVIDNTHRGILQEVTDRLGANTKWQVKTLEYMTRNRSQYPALAYDEEYERMKNAEIGYRSHRYPYIKPIDTKAVRLRDGDVVAMTTKRQGLDVQHVGLIKIKDGTPYLMHASKPAGKVLIEERPLADYLRRNPSITGIRVVRLTH